MSRQEPPLLTDAQPPPPGWSLDDDALAHAIAWLTRHHGRERSPASLLAGLPTGGRLAPDQALRALREAGYNAGLVQRRVAELPHLLLPAVLLLKQGDACILVARRGDGGYDIVMPGPEAAECTASEAELEAEYTGLALVATPQPRPAEVGATAALIDTGPHWLWGTLRRFVPYYRAALLAALLSNVLMLVTGLSTAMICDKVMPHQAYPTLSTLAAASVLVTVFALLSRRLRAYPIDLAGRKADLVVGSLLFRQTPALHREYRPASAGACAHDLSQLERIGEFSGSATTTALSDRPFVAIHVTMVFAIGGPIDRRRRADRRGDVRHACPSSRAKPSASVGQAFSPGAGLRSRLRPAARTRHSRHGGRRA